MSDPIEPLFDLVGSIITWIIMALIFAFPAMWLWNYYTQNVFMAWNLPVLTYWKTYGLLCLLSILK